MTSSEPQLNEVDQPGSSSTATRADVALSWAARIVSTLGVIVTAWAAVATGSMLVHGHPAYVILLAVVFLASAVSAVCFWLKPAATHRKLKVLRWAAIVAFSGILALVWWLVPSAAVEPALAAMKSDATVTVTETPTQIVMTPTKDARDVGVFFQPGARVDARAYAAVLRPLAENGHTVVIPKQPFGIAFLSTGAFAAARADHPPVDRWVVGGHSLGGVVSAIDAESFSAEPTDPVVGVLFYASYPSSDLSTLTAQVLSISGSNDGLATPEKIDASRALLPKDTSFTVIEGGVHANFGDYGPQAGDGQPTITRDAARSEITDVTLDFVDSFNR